MNLEKNETIIFILVVIVAAGPLCVLVLYHSLISEKLSKLSKHTLWNILQPFLLDLCSYIILPFIPFLIDFSIQNKISDKSVTLFTSMYVVALGMKTKSRLVVSIAFIICILSSVSHGYLYREEDKPLIIIVYFIAILFITGLYIMEFLGFHVSNRIKNIDILNTQTRSSEKVVTKFFHKKTKSPNFDNYS